MLQLCRCMATDAAKRLSFAELADEIGHLRPHAAEVQKKQVYHAIEIQESTEVTAGASRRKSSTLTPLSPIQEMKLIPAIRVA